MIEPRDRADGAPHLRRYRDGDARATWSVFHRAVHRTAAAHYTARQLRAWSPDTVDLAAWDERRRSAWTVVAVDAAGAVIGFADLRGEDELDMLFVDPSAGGRGVARLLVTAVLERAREQGTKRVTVRASHSARPVLAHLGFVFDQERPENPVRGVVVPNTVMHIDLG